MHSFVIEFSEAFSYELEGRYLFKLDNGCKNVDIRFDYKYFERLNNCKTIHGYLRISDLKIPENSTLSFDIVEITGYVLVENVSGLKSLGSLFPSLSVLRGEILHHGFTLLITHNDDLENIGFGLMTYIGKGNVLIQNNPKLCYTESVDWMQLRKGLNAITENNNQNCSESCSKCWADGIPQKICDDCESCLISDHSKCCDTQCIGGCKNNSLDCLACKHYKYVTENITACVEYEPLAFQLENHFLIDGLTCDDMDRIQLDGECLKNDECPLYENHYLIDNQCTYCQNCSEICSININSIYDLKNISTCNIAEAFQIENLEDSLYQDIGELLMEKLKTIAEINSCLIIKNSSGITNLSFLKMLRKISGLTEDLKCTIDGVRYSAIIKDNSNLQEGFHSEFKILARHGVYIQNNKNLCQTDAHALTNAFKSVTYVPNNKLQTKDCNHPKINVNTISTNDSVLLLTDLIRSNRKVIIKYWKDDMEEIRALNESFYEIDKLAPNMTYPFKIDVVDALDQIIYSTNVQFFKTSISNEIITKLESTNTLNSITLSWEAVTSFTNFYAQRRYQNFFFITYEGSNTEFCNHTVLKIYRNESQMKKFHKFRRYFLNDPIDGDKYFKALNHKFVDGTKNFINISDLVNSTCYRFDIYPCRRTNILMCSPKIVHFQATLAPNIEHSNSFLYFIGFSIFGISTLSVSIFLLYKFGLWKKDNFETHIELQNQGGVIDVDQWELERENIVQIKVLGSGEFGIVYKGYIKPNDEKLYAIKTLAPFKEAFEENFIKEAQIMRRFNAPHVVKLIGYCTKTRPLLVVMEYMMHGDLKKFLQRNRPFEAHDEKSTTTQKGSYTTVTKAILHPIRPIHQMAIEIADGMLYLEDIKFIHCDLACRNLMVHENYTLKIGDFGMARELYHTDYYKPGSRNKKIPLRWMAPEALGTEDMLPRYTSKSDVFSYGIVLFELVTFCDTPYAGCLDEEVIEIIKMGRILNKPQDCDDKIYELMKRCWQYNPGERIDFREVIRYLLVNFDIPNFSNASYYHKYEFTNE